MSRKIKFRAWDGKKMLKTASDADKWTKDENWGNDWQIFFELLEDMPTYLELMQYTGLKDKNGVEIFEGDIFSAWDARSKYAVQWIDQSASFRLVWVAGAVSDSKNYHYFDMLMAEYQFDKVGNIYENQGLLK